MALPILSPADLVPFATIEPTKAQAMIDDATAMAVRVAPCLASDLPDTDQAAAKAVLRNAILRWNDSGTGALSGLQQTAGSFQVSQTLDTRSPRRGLLWPSEITDLQGICSAGATTEAFEIDPTPTDVAVVHAASCSIMFGATYCSCGAVLTARLPLYENEW